MPDVPAAIEILSRLVAFDTTSHKSNRALVSFVEAYIAGHGIAAHLVPTADGEKASLFATIGPEDVAGIGLSGHTDVVPADPAAWTSDPFTLREEHGRLYGRGTADMKGYLACVLAMVPELKRRQLKVPVHILFSYDEEVGCTGVRPMIAELGDRLVKPRAVIVGEPTSMAVVDAHKGPVRWSVEVTGRAAHSSMAHLGVNAIAAAARLIGKLGEIEAELAAQPPDLRFTPPYPTLQVTEISGGIAANIVPASCRFVFDIRAMPGLDIEAIERRLADFANDACLPAMRRIAPEAAITICRVNQVPPFAADSASDIVALALKLAGENATSAVSYATEAGLFQDGGVAAVVCGPGDIAQAHTADEWITVSEIERCLAFLTRLADWAET
ncbi:acetylornithine deacetylase [Hyphomicrobium sp.]|uniref:acetylornithine deacetylase n=1 Tax=Hyphomicrobium sp. TaxID=82 RepID=UPI0025BF67EF|nr:acetylornithine deacetylase [Hyphomicrobium sp.]MCC7251480.1 acetylornithine deacetylase [Hyphomicrobium sp.]